MKKFILNWYYGKPTVVFGENIADAIRNAGFGPDQLHYLDNYEDEEGNRTRVAGKSDCGCVFHAEEGASCMHDLQLAGLV